LKKPALDKAAPKNSHSKKSSHEKHENELPSSQTNIPEA